MIPGAPVAKQRGENSDIQTRLRQIYCKTLFTTRSFLQNTVPCKPGNIPEPLFTGSYFGIAALADAGERVGTKPLSWPHTAGVD